MLDGALPPRPSGVVTALNTLANEWDGVPAWYFPVEVPRDKIPHFIQLQHDLSVSHHGGHGPSCSLCRSMPNRRTMEVFE